MSSSDDAPRDPLLPAATGVHVAGPSRPDEIDPFFKQVDGILKTYQFDYGAVAAFDQEVAFATIIGTCFFPPAWPTLLCSVPYYALWQKQNIADTANATHLAITHDGIKYVVDKHKTGCRLDCQDLGKISKTVPYDKMTDCDIEEPAGSAGPCCYLVPRVLHTVHVDTASSGAVKEGGGVTHELTIRGLLDADGFKKDVWAMKRGEVVDGVDGTVAPLAVSMVRDEDRATGGGGGGGRWPAGASAQLLQPLLQEQNVLLREMTAAVREGNARAAAAQSEAAEGPALARVAAALEETNALLRSMAGAAGPKKE